MSINILPQSTIRQITTSQIITSVSTAVKELIENAIDAEATSIQINLMNQGLDLIEVKDDGSGIPTQDVPLICQAATTSKITDITDLDSLSSYGFRGEALNALCQIGEVSVTTKTNSDPVASMYKFSHTGEVTSTQPSHFPNGTTVSVKNLFHNLPVRKQYLSSKNRMSEELRKVERVVKCLSLIHCKLRVTLTHNKCVIWQKNPVWTVRLSLSQVIPLNIVNNLDEIQYESAVHGAKLLLLLPKKSASEICALCLGNMQQAYFIYVNKRPVRVGKIEKMLSKEFSECFRSLIPSNKYPVCLVSIEVPSNAVDVNLEPNKTKVLLREVDELVACIKGKICDYYYDPGDCNLDPKSDQKNLNQIKSGVKRKLPEYTTEEQSVRKVCKPIDRNLTGNIETVIEKKEDGGFLTETTLSQLSSLLESKENTISNASYNETLESSYNTKVEMFDDISVSRVDSLDDTIPYYAYSSEVTNVKQRGDSAYHSEGNDGSFSLEIQGNETHSSEETKNEISMTQWSKGNVIINDKLLDEPTHVSVLNRIGMGNEARHDTPCKEERVIHSEGNTCPEEANQYLNPTVQDGLEMNTCHTDDSDIVNDNTLYFQANQNSVDQSNQNNSVDQSDVSFVPGTAPGVSEQLENFSTFAKEIRQDLLENKPLSFSQVASQMVTKSNTLFDSPVGDKRKDKVGDSKHSKSKEIPVPSANKSMLDFVSQKIIRSYPDDKSISFNIAEVKLKIMEKSHGNSSIERNLSSEESDVENGDEIKNKHPISDSLLGDCTAEVNLDERWNYLMETCRNQCASEVECKEDEQGSNRTNKDLTSSQSSDSILLKKYRFRIIGSHDKNWFYMCNESLGVLHVEHLYKIVTFHKHLRTFQVPCSSLEDCIVLDKHFVHTVLNMDLCVKRVTTSDSNVTILKPYDKVFTLNGIGLWIRKNLTTNEFSVLVNEKPKDLAAFNSKDTAELLNLITTHKTMEACRPLKIQKLIQTVTEEYCTKNPLCESEEVVIELVAYWFEHIRELKCPFLYDGEILYELYVLP
ncbi:hypothetical protein M8J76_012585 [Diaphorina citri]|nr:hypothetical protein M8J75_006694 [Diaphorina citri]KAI5741336.1 hypothetical protein M8J76_012585 [Diaphorina citri]